MDDIGYGSIVIVLIPVIVAGWWFARGRRDRR